MVPFTTVRPLLTSRESKQNHASQKKNKKAARQLGSDRCSWHTWHCFRPLAVRLMSARSYEQGTTSELKLDRFDGDFGLRSTLTIFPWPGFVGFAEATACAVVLSCHTTQCSLPCANLKFCCWLMLPYSAWKCAYRPSTCRATGIVLRSMAFLPRFELFNVIPLLVYLMLLIIRPIAFVCLPVSRLFCWYYRLILFNIDGVSHRNDST